MPEITQLQKHIYNKHLIVSRQQRNKPFKVKQNFDDLIDTDKQKFLIRISNLFKNHPEIDTDLFFAAPYYLYPDVGYFGLDYFSTLRAIKSYTLYKRSLLLKDPDSQVKEVKRSLVFIANYCIDNNLHLHQYQHHRTSDLYTWMKHYKENKINIYVMFMYSGILSSAKSISDDLRKMFLSDFVEQFEKMFTNYNNSTQLKGVIQKSYPIIANFVEKQLSNKKTNL